MPKQTLNWPRPRIGLPPPLKGTMRQRLEDEYVAGVSKLSFASLLYWSAFVREIHHIFYLRGTRSFLRKKQKFVITRSIVRGSACVSAGSLSFGI